MWASIRNAANYLIDNIDKETGFCLKGVAVINNTTVIYFETKKFIQEPNTNHYIEELNKYNNKNTH